MLQLKNSKRSMVFGVGVNDFIDPISSSGKHIIEYHLWTSILRRCYSPVFIGVNPTYKGCEVEPFLLSFTNFYNFVRGLKGFGEVDEKGKPFQMDKDLLVKGNKTYSVDTICFIPQEINSFLTNRKACRGGYPLGVYYIKKYNKFMSSIRCEGVKKHLGYYPTAEEAFLAYKTAKEAQAKELAEKWKDNIDQRVYDALMKYEVFIDD